MPPGFLIDQNRKLVHSFGGAGQFIRVQDGRVSNDLLDQVDAPQPLHNTRQHRLAADIHQHRLIARPDAPDLLARELSSKRYVPRMIAMGTNTDPYQPAEKEKRVTRESRPARATPPRASRA